MASRLNYDIGELFGSYCLIESGNRHSKYRYRIIRSGLKSRIWSETPLSYERVYHPNRHDDVEDVLFVVLDEEISENSKVVRVRLKDVELIGEDR